ncbi:MAG TPA: glycosyltransferase family 1 protein [Thermomicrobiales bacterium]|nr:glycosyltransferase family 1 protein [Thermomicrobiales bacterium]
MSSNTERPVSVALDLRLAGYRHGGIARYGTQLHEALRTRRDIEILALRSWSRRPDDARGLRLRTPPHHRLERIAVPIELRLRRVTTDVYHALDFVAPRLRSTTAIATVHDLAFRHWPEDLAPDALAYYRRLERSRHWTDAWITPSAWTATELADEYGIELDAIHVIPHGESLGLLAQPVVERGQRGDFVLAVGTVEPRKQYDVMLDAIADLRSEVSLVIAGQAGWNTERAQQRLRNTTGVTWLSSVDDERLRALYRGAAAVVIPSRAEGFGLAALEAMAAGTPVISSGGGALKELTGAASLNVADARADAWSDAIRRVLSDAALWSQMAASGRERARVFTWRRSADATAGVYIAHAGT